MKPKALSLHIEQGLAYIARQQEKNGAFLATAFAKRFQDGDSRRTTFHTSLILSSLSLFPHSPAARDIAARGAAFLLGEKSPYWSFNYWSRDAAEHGRIPDDLDDTFAALGALNAWGLVAGGTWDADEALASAVKILIATETKTGGPYNTWIVPNVKKTSPENASWRDIDLAVNANVAHFLAQKEIVVPALTAYVERAIAQKKFFSRYYSPIPIVYFISRWYRSPHTKALRSYLISTSDRRGRWENPLMTALAVSSLLSLGAEQKAVRRGVRYLIDSQKRGGCWPPDAFYTEEVKNGVPWFSASRMLATAACVEALGRYDTLITTARQKIAVGKITVQERLLEAKTSLKIAKRAKRRFAHASPAMRNIIYPFIDKTVAQDAKHEITLLPYFFANNIKKVKKKSRVDESAVLDLCTANLLGWTGYTICDKILDGEAPVAWLPAANIAVREVSLIFKKLLPEGPAYAATQRLLDGIEEANLWEHTACKLEKTGTKRLIPEVLPVYGENAGRNLILAEKSLGHALGPMAIMFLLEAGSRKHAIMVKSFFEQYLIARQLNDDAHDWLADLENGFLNSASVGIIARWRKKYPHKKYFDVVADKEKLRKLFWDEVLDDTSHEIFLHCKKAREMLDAMLFLADTSFFASLLEPLERSAAKAIEEHNATAKFIKTYGGDFH